MCYTRNIDEACFSTRSDHEAAEGEMEFYLSNGQRDEYPRAYTIPAAKAVEVFDYFLERTELPPSVKWHKDF